jgi:exosortase E/protease (VPEID-CTERM system)
MAETRRSFGVALALMLAELVLVAVYYTNGVVFDCRASAPLWLCRLAGGADVRAYAFIAGVAVVFASRPAAWRALTAGARPRPHAGWAAAHVAGAALLVAPSFFLRDGAPTLVLTAVFSLWFAGGALAAVAGALTLAPAKRWFDAASAVRGGLAAAALLAILAPRLADGAQRVWEWNPFATATLSAVALTLDALGQPIARGSDPADIGVGAFMVNVGRQCSGIEGFALIAGFLSLYFFAFREALRFPHALALLPVGIAASWMLNVVRIVALILLGAHVSPDLAVSGFHSHAGWLMFTTLAIGLMTVAHATPWFRSSATPAARAPLPRLAQDWSAARLVPFIVFMASALLASTFASMPELFYPARVVAMWVALWAFRGLYRALPWRLDAWALGAGLAVGTIWILVAPPEPTAALDAALVALPAWIFLVWAVARVVGTTLLVPMTEELLFRSYLLERLDFGGIAGRLFAVAVSTVLFAALHGRWIEAGAAGLVFAWLALRRDGGLVDAVVAHMTANGLIALWAITTGRWSII